MADTDNNTQSWATDEQDMQVVRLEQDVRDTRPKRGPGRPPSKAPPPPLDRKGIVDSPKDPNNRLEFVYSDPMVFKSLFTYFKNIKARELHLRCTPKGLTFFARDHLKISRIVAHVAGEHVNWHYCESEYWLGINRDNVE